MTYINKVRKLSRIRQLKHNLFFSLSSSFNSSDFVARFIGLTFVAQRCDIFTYRAIP